MSSAGVKKNIALFGGSFNPPHEGHLEIVRRVACRRSIDEVWILPVWRHPFRKRLPAFKKRVARCHIFFCPPPLKACPERSRRIRGGTGGRYDPAWTKVGVKPYEKYPGATGRTVDLVRHLQRRFPDHRFWWVMGSDTYRQRKRWKQFGELKKKVRLIVFKRGKGSPIPDVASRKIRGKKATT